MKKIIALLVLATMVFGVLAFSACKKDPEASTPSLIERPSKDSSPSAAGDSSTENPDTSDSTQPDDSSTTTPDSSSTEPDSSSTEPDSSSTEPSSSSTEPDPGPGPGPEPSGEVLSTSDDLVKNGVYISDLKIVNAGTYMLGSTVGSNYIFKIEVIDGGTTYTMNASDLETFDKVKADQSATKQDGEAIACGTNNYFALVCAATKTAVNESGKPFADGFSGTKRVNFGGKTQKSSTTGEMVNGIKFTVTGEAPVKVWWVCGDVGRQVELIKIEGSAPVDPNPPQPTVPQEVTDLIAAITAIGEVTADNYTTKLDAIVAAETAYTALSAENQALVTNYATLQAARTAYDGFKAAADEAARVEAEAQAKITAFKEAVTAIATYEFTDAYKALLDAADTAYAAVPTTHTSQVEAEKATLDEMKAKYEAEKFAQLPQEVKDVITAIDAIGTIDATNYVAKDTEVATVETAFAALTDENKALVSNAATLTSARETINLLKAEEEANQAKVADFQNKVNAITTVEYTDACLAAINDAYAAYELIPETHKALAATELTALDGKKAEYAELDAQDKVTKFQAAVTAIGTVEATDACKALIDTADTAYTAVPATHTSQVAAEKTTLDNAKAEYARLVALAANQKVVDDFMLHYNYVKSLSLTSNVAEYEKVIAAYEALTADQVALITDAEVATNIASWKEQIAAIVPAEPVTKTFSFNGNADGWTSSVGMKFGSALSGQGWLTSSNGRSATFETTEVYNDVTSVSIFVAGIGGGGVKYELFIGDTLANTYQITSSGWNASRLVKYNGAALTGKIKVVATASSNRGMGIDEAVITYTPAN